MSYFPFFVELENQPVLIVGGGSVALRKIEKLLPYGPRLTVCAPMILSEIKRIPRLTLLRQPFTPQLLEDARFVIAATDNPDLNHSISDLCRSKGIPVNVVDDRAYCSFLFPALVKQGDLSVGISTGGTSPTAAIWLKRQIEQMLPENFEELLNYLDSLRDTVKQAEPDERRRAACFSNLFAACMSFGHALSETEFREILLNCSSEEVNT